MTIDTPDTILWLTDARGRYLPRDFATSFADRSFVKGVTDESWQILEAGPSHKHYWETWETVLDRATVHDPSGVKYKLYQQGDLWLIPEGMEWSDEVEGYVWPETTASA